MTHIKQYGFKLFQKRKLRDSNSGFALKDLQGMFLMSIALCAIGIVAYKELNTLVVIFMMVHLTIYQLSMGTYMYVYVAQVAEERA